MLKLVNYWEYGRIGLGTRGMGKIEKEIEIVGQKEKKKLKALFDSGADTNYVRTEFSDGISAEELGFIRYRTFRRIKLGDGRYNLGEVVTFPQLIIDDVSIEKPEMIIMKGLPYDAVIGAFLMQQLRITLNMGEEQVEWEESRRN